MAGPLSSIKTECLCFSFIPFIHGLISQISSGSSSVKIVEAQPQMRENHKEPFCEDDPRQKF